MVIRSSGKFLKYLGKTLNISYNKRQKSLCAAICRAAQLKHIAQHAYAVNWAKLQPLTSINVHWKLVQAFDSCSNRDVFGYVSGMSVGNTQEHLCKTVSCG